MDTSEYYIEQCQKAGEIQALRKLEFENGDWFYDRDDKEAHPVISAWWYHRQSACYEIMGTDKYHIDTDVWLPRQDQLQEMLQPCGFSTLLVYFPEFAAKAVRDENITSMEQLWLSYVMWKLYHKKWNGEDWT